MAPRCESLLHVAQPDDKWGKCPAPLSSLNPVNERRSQHDRLWPAKLLAGFKTPKRFIFQELAKNPDGKYKKNSNCAPRLRSS